MLSHWLALMELHDLAIMWIIFRTGSYLRMIYIKARRAMKISHIYQRMESGSI